MFLLWYVHVLIWTALCDKVIHCQKNTTKYLNSITILFTLRYCSEDLDWEFGCFPESKSMFLFQQNGRLEMFLFPIENLGWCSSAQCSSAYDFTVGTILLIMVVVPSHWCIPPFGLKVPLNRIVVLLTNGIATVFWAVFNNNQTSTIRDI